MIYELRRYDIKPENWDGYRTWCEDFAFPLFHDQFHFPTVGFFEVVPLEGREMDAYNATVGVRWILAWESIEERDRRWVEVAAADTYTTVVQHARTENGDWLFHIGAEMTLLKAWPVSPLQ